MSNTYEASSPTPKGQRTKEKILEASLHLFSQNGFKETTVRDIANHIGIKQGALYNHFKNKDDILRDLISSLTSSAIVTLFDEEKQKGKDPKYLYREGKKLLNSIANTFRLLSFDKKNEALFKLLMQELYKSAEVRETYNEYFYQENVKKLSTLFFMMMQDEMIISGDPLLLANEFLSPLFFYQMQISLLKIDRKSTSSIVTMFDKHVDFFWDKIKIEEPQETLF